MDNDRSWLGVDGGASHTTAALLAPDGRVVWRGEAGPMKDLDGPDGAEVALAVLAADIRTSAVALPDGVAVAMTGATVPGKAARIRDLLATLFPGRAAVVTSDLAAAVWGAARGSDALLLLCGTGSGAVALRHGGITRVGAHGSEFGDEGSAYSIGQAAVRAALKAADGRAPATRLGERLAAAAAVRDVFEIPRLARAEAWPSARVAALAPVVGLTAAEGDAVARALLETAGTELGDLAVALLREAPPSLPLSLAGGGWKLSPLLWPAARARIRARLGRDVEPVAALADAAVGAALWARAGAPEPA